jgi:hypothetical protein
MKMPLHEYLVVWPTLTGFCLGGLGSSTYLLCGGSYFFNVPDWAVIVFCPGFLAGYQAYGLGIPEDYAKIIGVLAVGLTYSALAVVISFALLGVDSLRSDRNAVAQERTLTKCSEADAVKHLKNLTLCK